ncbi:glycosyltransferase family 2 protein [Nonlabens agnitus]|uniref:Glycosyltransferase 2-like domain-containing protein n=1 Tax=Nonlabens agnitus TaxID=870484 RepID=A0A2S9WU59_9FLAO|nr:glycosyltransferase family 2 protein [Nonlabens agnitus]PRP66999.1 hypothetical protein BST86_07750 [Nonlabens agnitus]
MKISVITINYNNLDGLRKTIQSVFSQDFTDFEFIVIDGNSTDGSRDYLIEHQSHIDYWVSEPDEGIYHAMNKGIHVSKGDYLFFLNSGDWFYSAEVLTTISLNSKCGKDLYYGDVVLKFTDRKMLHTYPQFLRLSHFVKGTICHQAVIIKKELFDRLGYYNTDYKIIADWDFLVRALFINGATYLKLDVIFTNYDMSGVSADPENRITSKNEKHKILKELFSGIIEDYEDYFDARLTLGKIKYYFGDEFFLLLKRPFF